MPKVSIIILNWNGYRDSADCIRSLRGLSYPSYETVVVDNGSTDGSVAKLREEFRGIIYIENKENLGFAGGNNVGMRYGMERGADYMLLLNNDVVVGPNFLDVLVQAGEGDKRIGVLGPKIYCYPETSRLWPWGLGGEMDWKIGRTKNLTPGDIERGNWDVMRDVDYVSGCAFLVKRRVIDEIGFLDERYYLYFEEADFCIRAGRGGFRVVYVPDSVIWHKSNASSGGWDSPLRLYYTTRNRLLFMKTHLDESRWRCFLLYFLYEGLFKRATKLFITRRSSLRDLRALWQGWQDFRCRRFYRGPDEIH